MAHELAFLFAVIGLFGGLLMSIYMKKNRTETPVVNDDANTFEGEQPNLREDKQ